MATTDKAQTTLNDDTTKPSVTAPGDGPADTTDPLERAQSVPVRPGAEALATGTVNGVRKLTMPPTPPRDSSNDRIEEYELSGPDGTIHMIRHNLETGATAVMARRPGPPPRGGATGLAATPVAHHPDPSR